MSDETAFDLSDSTAQRTIERVMLDHMQAAHPEWRPATWKEIAVILGLAPVWKQAQPDAVWESADGTIIIAECYARVKRLLAGNERKLALDALKLLSLRNAAPEPQQLRCLLIVTAEVEHELQKNGWLQAAIRQAVEVVGVALAEVHRRALDEAVSRQSSGQARLRRREG